MLILLLKITCIFIALMVIAAIVRVIYEIKSIEFPKHILTTTLVNKVCSLLGILLVFIYMIYIIMIIL